MVLPAVSVGVCYNRENNESGKESRKRGALGVELNIMKVRIEERHWERCFFLLKKPQAWERQHHVVFTPSFIKKRGWTWKAK